MRIDIYKPENCFGFVTRQKFGIIGVVDLTVGDIDKISIPVTLENNDDADLVVVKQNCYPDWGEDGTYYTTHHVALRDPSTGILKQRAGFGEPIKEISMYELRNDPNYNRPDFFIELRKLKN